MSAVAGAGFERFSSAGIKRFSARKFHSGINALFLL